MPRRAKVLKRETPPDAKYDNVTLAKLINKIMKRGKKSTAESIIYDALNIIEQQGTKSPLSVVEQAVRNAEFGFLGVVVLTCTQTPRF